MKWPQYDSTSRLDRAVTEVDRALIDLKCTGQTSKAQMARAMNAMAVLKTIANYCKYDHYDKIRDIDREEADND